jgi:hypothetical protein
MDGQKENLMANRGFKSRVHRHTLLEECVGRGGFIFISSQVPSMTGTEIRYSESPPPCKSLLSAKFRIRRLVLYGWFCL